MKKRNEIEEKYKWDLSGYYKTEQDFENDFKFVQNNYKHLSDFENKLNNKSDIFDCLELDDVLSRKMSKLYVYASLVAKQDMSNQMSQKTIKRCEKLSLELSEVSSFIVPELCEQSDEFLLSLAQDEKFNSYDLFFKEIVRDKKHMLSKKEERLLSLTGEFSDEFTEIFDMFDTTDIEFEPIENSDGEKFEFNTAVFLKYMISPDRKVRKNAYQRMNGTYGKLYHMIATNYVGNLKSDWFYSKVRGFSSCLEHALYDEDVDVNVYNALVESVNDNLSVFHRFFELKRQILKLDKFAVYDIYAYTSKHDKTYSFDFAFDIVKSAVGVLGDDYVELLETAKNQRWIDVFPNFGKDTGAFSWGTYDAHPVVLLNHQDTIGSMFTIAHELGHMAHSYYSNKTQVHQKADYTIFVAEVASTVNEMLLDLFLLHNAKTKQEKLFYLDYLLKMFYSTVFRQTLFAEFEQQAHTRYEQGEDTTPDALNELYYDINKKYFGKKVELLDETKYEWLRIPHFYSSFYVYKYATGLISAFYIANKIFEKEENSISAYRKFLTLGHTLPPVELLKIAGVDLSDKNTFKFVFEKLNELLDEYQSLINE